MLHRITAPPQTRASVAQPNVPVPHARFGPGGAHARTRNRSWLAPGSSRGGAGGLHNAEASPSRCSPSPLRRPRAPPRSMGAHSSSPCVSRPPRPLPASVACIRAILEPVACFRELFPISRPPEAPPVADPAASPPLRRRWGPSEERSFPLCLAAAEAAACFLRLPKLLRSFGSAPFVAAEAADWQGFGRGAPGLYR